MIKKLRPLGLVLVLFILFTTLAIVGFGPFGIKVLKQLSRSSDGGHCAYIVLSGSEQDSPPYGQLVYIDRCWARWIFQLSATQVYGDYCSNVSASWIDNRTLKIQCEKKGIVDRAKRFYSPTYKNIEILLDERS